MKVINKIIISLTAILSIAAAMTAQAQTIGGISAKGTTYTVEYQLALPSPASDYSNTITPMFCGTKDTIYLEPITVRGARNARKYRRKMVLNGHKQDPLPYLRSGVDSMVAATYTLNAKTYPWILDESITLCVKNQEEGCCNVSDISLSCSDPFRCRRPFAPLFSPVAANTGAAGALEADNPLLQHISQYHPYDSRRKQDGALYVHFPLDKWTLKHDFRNNAATLDRIVSITREIMADTTSSVKMIQIIGLASPEGPVKRNMLLGKNRAAALRDYVMREVGVSDSIFELYNGGEAWAELRNQVAESDMDGRDQLLEIIDNEYNPDIRERKMKRLNGGKTYRYLKNHVLGDQRNSGFIRIYYDYVPDTVAATINEAIQHLNAQRYDEALALLRTVEHDHRSYNALGVALYMTGSQEEATDYFRKAAAKGDNDARQNLEQLK